MTNFWLKLTKPFMVLAPMEDVTDYVFREIVCDLPRPDVFFTEFTSSDGLCSAGKDVTSLKLRFSERQRPIVAQIWGTNTKHMFKSAQLIQELGFDGIDINMGCPDRAVLKKGAGGAMCNNPKLAGEVIEAVKKGAPKLPLSVKTRLGFSSLNPEWLPFLFEQDIQALTIHGRTVKQLSKGEVDWYEIKKAVDIRNNLKKKTVVIGNGDIKSYQEALLKHDEFKVDGIMIGRGIFSNPWIFEKENVTPHSQEDYINLLFKHLNLFDSYWGENKNFEIMKKFFKMYLNNFYEASNLRQKLMECKTKSEVDTILKSWQKGIRM